MVEKPAETTYLNCIRCGLCLAVCPTYREHLTETASPRGRVALARKGLEGELQLSPNLIEQMYACLACMACNEICPVGIRPAELALSMRHVQEQLHPAAWKRPLFEGLIPHPGRMEARHASAPPVRDAGHPPPDVRLGPDAAACPASCATWKPCCRICPSARCARSSRGDRGAQRQAATEWASSWAARRACCLPKRAPPQCAFWRAMAAP